MVRYRYRTTGEFFDDVQIRNFFNAQAQERGLWSPSTWARRDGRPQELTGSQSGFSADRKQRRNSGTMKKIITAAIGGALLSGSLLGAGLASADPPYANCAAARADGAAPIYEGDPGYRDPLDRDGDGVACE